jgi:hypothetical protein
MSTLRVTTLQNLSGTEVYTCKAWVNFNGTGTVAIRASGNVSSITDNGAGDYTVNFTTNFADANYSVIGTGRSQNDAAGQALLNISSLSSPTTSSVRLKTLTPSVAYNDSDFVSVAVFR